MDGKDDVKNIASKLGGLLVEDDDGGDGSAPAVLLRGDDDEEDAPHPQREQQRSRPFVSGLVDMAGEVLRYVQRPQTTRQGTRIYHRDDQP